MEFLLSCERLDVPQMKALLGNGVDIEAEDVRGNTGLFYAVQKSDNLVGVLKAVKFLVGEKASVTHRNKEGATVLHRIAYANHASCVPVVVRAGADVNAVDGEGQSVLQTACVYDAYETVLTLVS